LSDLWEQTKLFPSALQHDEFVHELIADLQSALAAMLIVLRTREERTSRDWRDEARTPRSSGSCGRV